MTSIVDSRDQLRRGIDALGISLAETQIDLLFDYLILLEKWNRAYNLSAVRQLNEMVARHLLDSLAVLPYVKGRRWLDVGSGGGLPGVPLAIALPNAEFTLIDSNGKKTRFLQQVKTELTLDNLYVVHQRVQDFKRRYPFDSIISRAFAGVNAMLTSCRHLLAGDGRIYIMAGRYPAADLTQLSAGFVLERAHALEIPEQEGERHLLILAPEHSSGE